MICPHCLLRKRETKEIVVNDSPYLLWFYNAISAKIDKLIENK